MLRSATVPAGIFEGAGPAVVAANSQNCDPRRITRDVITDVLHCDRWAKRDRQLAKHLLKLVGQALRAAIVSGWLGALKECGHGGCPVSIISWGIYRLLVPMTNLKR